jgi:hypothetical protein
VSATERSAGDQLIELSKLCELLGMEQSETVEAHFAEAAALARELFPPIIRRLVWIERRNDFVSHNILASNYEIYPYEGAYHAVFCVNLERHLLLRASLDEAKAFCESHHQARFKELLA